MELFSQMLNIDSTSGKEREFALWCMDNLQAPSKRLFDFEGGELAVLLSWGDTPKLVFCTHLDTVPPYIAPRIEQALQLDNKPQTIIHGRGACDAKGQIYAMYKACLKLQELGYSDFALLLLSGEEVGSKGAKAFSKMGFNAKYLLIGEPTDNCMVSASKGTRAYELIFKGKSCHSGYPEYGSSAVEAFVAFNNRLKDTKFAIDPELGATTWNIGELHSNNPQNILSDELRCKLYFRTSFAAATQVENWMHEQQSSELAIIERGGDKPARYHTVEGIPSKLASFGSDAPHLSGFEHKMICGPGSILVAHRENEQVTLQEIQIAIDNYIKIYETLLVGKSDS